MNPKVLDCLERYREIVPDWKAFVASCAAPLPPSGWLHPGRPHGLNWMREDGFDVEPLSWRAGGIRWSSGPGMAESLAYRAGLFHVQEEVSMVPVEMLAPVPGERLLDLCAAPGNKTAELATQMAGLGTVVANDRAGGRLNVLRTTIDRLGLPNVAVTVLDGRSGRFPSAWFDAAIVDVPCSCEGTLRKHPRAPLATSAESRQRLAQVQRALLENALRALRPGGRLVYSTCTFAPEENECVVDQVLRTVPGVTVEPVSLSGLASSPGLTEWGGQVLHASLEHALRFWPGQVDSGGFFAVLLRKAGVDGGGTGRGEAGADAGGPGGGEAGAPETGDVRSMLEFVQTEFGLAPDWSRDLRFQLRPGKSLDAVSTDLDEAPGLKPVQRGFSFLRLSGRVPKLTTQAALWLGSRPTRQVTTVSRESLWAFLRGDAVSPGPTPAGFGFAQVRCEGLPFGVGLYRPDDGALDSLYPRSWGGLGRPR
ncbi:MAG: hypothetical protein JJ896_16720 [Rhodothermales bacterium]|nr:hypothetical protein [Rhodothermales bacterium]